MNEWLLVSVTVFAFCGGACTSRPNQSVAPKIEPMTTSRTPAAAPASASGKPVEDCVATLVPSASVPSAALPFSAIILHAGDVVCLVPAAKDAWTAASRVAAESPHLAIRMTAESGRTMIEARNGTRTRVHYRAAMQIPGNPTWQETSIVPVMPGLFGLEDWPHPIDALAVFAVEAE